jgi:DNA-binding response OmpR family regulator
MLLPRIEAEASPPVQTPPDPLVSGKPQRSPGEHHLRILLVDDEETIREHGALALREAGFEVVLAGSGEKALDRFEAEPASYDLVVLDLSLPGISGREVCAQILKSSPSQRILVVTGYELGTGASEPEVPGALGHVLKPFRMSSLVTEVRRLCALPT